MSLPPFHLAIPVHDLSAARAFYGDFLRRLRLSLRPLGLRALLDLRPPTSAPAPAPTTGAVASARMARAR